MKHRTSAMRILISVLVLGWLVPSLTLMNTAATLNDGTPIEYSLGWELSTDAHGNHCVDKYGSGTGVSTYLMRIPDKHFAVAVLVNLSHGNIQPFARRIADVVLAAP